MGRELLPLPPPPEPSHVFVRVLGVLDLQHLDGLEVTACSHEDMDGALLTEALVSGEGAVQRVAHLSPQLAVQVHTPDWVRESIATAAGRCTASDGAVALHAIRARDDELHLVSHPRALCATTVLAQVARWLDAWICL